MRGLKRFVAIAASFVVMAGFAGPAIADDSINLTLTTTEGGGFTWHLWYDNLTLPSQVVDYDSGGTVRQESILQFSDTSARSTGWTITVAADNLVNTDNPAYYIDHSNIKLIHHYNNLTHGPGHCFQSSFLAANPNTVPGNPYQTITFPATNFGSGVTLDQSRLMASGTATRGCSGVFQNSFYIDVTVPGGTVPGTYKTSIVATQGLAP